MARLAAIEDMAGMSILCSDKTGTLTMNKMEIQEETPIYKVRESYGICLTSYYIMLYYIKLLHIKSNYYHINIISYHIILYRVISYHIISCHIISCHNTSYHIMSNQIISCIHYHNISLSAAQSYFRNIHNPSLLYSSTLN